MIKELIKIYIKNKLNKIFSVLENGLTFLHKKKIMHEKVNIITPIFTKPFPNIKKTGNISNIKKFIFVNRLILNIIIYELKFIIC